MIRPSSFRGILRQALWSTAAVGTIAVLGAGCLDRPVVPSEPKTTARIAVQIPHDVVNKIDFLFMIDNSTSMLDKQNLLKQAVPDLLTRFLVPNCVSNDDPTVVVPRTGNGCPANSGPEFNPIADIHIGVISSSLGSHNSEVVAQERGLVVECTGADAGHPNDMAHLLTRTTAAPTGDTTLNPPFLNWNTTGGGPHPINNQQTLTTAFQNLVIGVGQDGCGYEAQLESIYRFLMDPTPPATFKRTDNPASPTFAFGYATVDTEILTERQQFLRPDSLVAVIALTDENDCSVSDIGNANLYLAIDPNTLENPLLSNVNDPLGNQPNLRCFHQKQRFGQDGLWPIARYVNGFLDSQLGSNLDGLAYPNPLYTDLSCPKGMPDGGITWPGVAANCVPSGSTRPPNTLDSGLVFFAGVVGVPWQDIARQDTNGPPNISLGYMTAEELTAANRWDVILGNPDADPAVDPTDPFMIESRVPRQTGAMNPVTGDAIQPPNSGATASKINGHEWSPSADLEYACTFPLAGVLGMPSENCTPDKLPDGTDGPAKCDCAGGDSPMTTLNPLCEDNAGMYGANQFYAKAYPGVRELQVLKGVGAQGIVASICPAISDQSQQNNPAWGYRPAVGAIVDKLKTRLKQQCFSRPLQPTNPCAAPGDSDYGQVNCVVLEVSYSDSCDCNVPGFSEASHTPEAVTLPADVRAQASCICEIQQLGTGTDVPQGTYGLEDCLNTPNIDPMLDGWCYVDPALGLGRNPEVVKDCGATSQRTVRYPARNGTTAYISCQEAASSVSGDAGAACVQQ